MNTKKTLAGELLIQANVFELCSDRGDAIQEND